MLNASEGLQRIAKHGDIHPLQKRPSLSFAISNHSQFAIQHSEFVIQNYSEFRSPMNRPEEKAPISLQPTAAMVPIPRGPVPVLPSAPPRRQVHVTIDGQKVSVPEGPTLLEATRQLGIDTPTPCFLETL